MPSSSRTLHVLFIVFQSEALPITTPTLTSTVQLPVLSQKRNSGQTLSLKGKLSARSAGSVTFPHSPEIYGLRVETCGPYSRDYIGAAFFNSHLHSNNVHGYCQRKSECFCREHNNHSDIGSYAPKTGDLCLKLVGQTGQPLRIVCQAVHNGRLLLGCRCNLLTAGTYVGSCMGDFINLQRHLLEHLGDIHKGAAGKIDLTIYPFHTGIRLFHPSDSFLGALENLLDQLGNFP